MYLFKLLYSDTVSHSKSSDTESIQKYTKIGKSQQSMDVQKLCTPYSMPCASLYLNVNHTLFYFHHMMLHVIVFFCY